ncbi:MAG: tetratricopeptide repeat protein [Trueperaceae bacterium]
MQPHLRRTLVSTLAGLLLTLAGAASAQATAQRIVLLPFDTEASIDAFALAFPSALQRAMNEIDGVYVPGVGDAAVVAQRVADAGGDVLSEVRRVFDADAVVLGRIRGSDALTIELVVATQAGDDRNATVSGRLGDLAALWRAAADGLLDLLDVSPSLGDLADLRRVLADVPSLPSLGPVGSSSARVPGVRLDQLEAAAALDPDSAWVVGELARVAAIAGDGERALREAERAVELGGHAEAYALLGMVRLARNDPAAGEAFEAALSANPAHGVALAGLARSGVGPERAAELLEAAIAAAPRQVDAHLALAELQTSPARVIQVLRRASAWLPDSASVQLALVDAALDAGDARGAIELLRSAVSDPVGRRPAIYLLAARLPTELAREALAFAREGRDVFPDDPDLHRLEIDLLRATGDAAGASAALAAWVETGSAPLREVAAFAEALASQGRFDEAQEWLATVADADDDADLRSARIELAAGRARAALTTLEPRVAAGDADALRRTLYAIALGRIGRTDEGTAMLEDVVRSAGEPDADARTREAGALAERALAVLADQRQVSGADAVALSPDASTAFEQGLFALENDDMVTARDAFVRARGFDDAGLLAFYEGYARQVLGDPRGAIDAYEAARDELGDNDVLLNNLGYAQLQVGRLDLALDTLRLALEANPDNARAHLNLGLAFYGLSRFGDAADAFDDALALDPSLAGVAGSVIDDARRRAGR